MKNMFLVTLLLLSNQLFGQVSVTLHHYDYYDFSATKKNIKSTVSIYVKEKIGASLKFTAFSLVNNKWGESLIGLEYMPYNWLALEGEVGIETNIQSYGYKRNLIRRAELVTVATRNFLLLGTFEQGSLNWFDLRMFYLIQQVGIGAMASKYYGLGPVLLYRIGKSRFNVWSSWLYNWDNSDYGTMVGIYYKM